MRNSLTSFWHTTCSTANFCGKSCAQHVQGLGHAWVWFLKAVHTPSTLTAPVGENQVVMHGLYHFCTQTFPTDIIHNSPLLNSQLYAVSTLSIMTTTKYIKE